MRLMICNGFPFWQISVPYNGSRRLSICSSSAVLRACQNFSMGTYPRAHLLYLHDCQPCETARSRQPVCHQKKEVNASPSSLAACSETPRPTPLEYDSCALMHLASNQPFPPHTIEYPQPELMDRRTYPEHSTYRSTCTFSIVAPSKHHPHPNITLDDTHEI